MKVIRPLSPPRFPFSNSLYVDDEQKLMIDAGAGVDVVFLENFTVFAKPPRGLSCEFADASKAPAAACFVSADIFDRRRVFYDI